MSQFTNEEIAFMGSMSTIDHNKIHTELLCFKILQVLGVVILALTAFLAARFYTEKLILLLIIPYFLTGIFVFIQGLFGKKTMKSKNLISKISRKVLDDIASGSSGE